MAERWQQWMPFHIDRFRGSPEVQAMHPTARSGYLYLLSSSWQTDDCTVSADPFDLATESGLGDELWAIHGGRILRNFKLVDGRYRNSVVFEEWQIAKSKFAKNHGPELSPEELSEARRLAGIAGANKRWQKHGKLPSNPKQKHGKRMANDGLQEQEHIQKAKVPSRDASDSRHVPFKLACETYAKFKRVEFVWDGGEAKQLAALLAASPGLTLDTFQRCLQHRAKSVVTHGERPREWLGTILKYQEGPLDQFGKPQGAGNGTFKGKSGHSIDAARAAIEEIENSHASGAVGDQEAGEAGQRGLPSVRGGPGELRTGRPRESDEPLSLEAP